MVFYNLKKLDLFSEKCRMKNLIFFILSLFTFTTFAVPVEKDPFVSHWKVVMDGSHSGNTIRSIERKIVTPYSRYTVASVTMMELNFEGDQSMEATRSFLQKEYKLTGLQEKKFNNAYRFEGYNEITRRQVVIFISFSKNKIRVSNAVYRPTYGRTIALEVELIHRKYHNVDDRVSFLKKLKIALPFIEEAYAQTDCTKCAGNPMCLMLCRSANSGSSAGTGVLAGAGSSSPTSGFGFGGLNLDNIQQELSNTNVQLNALNGNMNVMNQNWGNTNTQIEGMNVNWNNTNTQIGIANQNWNNSNQNWAETNKNHAKTNEELAKANQNMENLTNVVDKNAQKALEESQAWRAMTEKESAEWRALMKEQSDKGLAIAEKMSNPNHMFKMATYSAAGAVLGASVANLAIQGVTAAVGFLWKWATGELKTMKQEELLKEFAQAMKVYSDSTLISKGLEASIDSVLANLALHKKFKLQNSEVLANIQKYIITTEFEIEDARKNKCVDDLVTLNQKMTEFQSLAKILDMADPQKQMCIDLKEMFRKLAEIEGVLQNARPNLLKAEDALNWQKARAQNDSIDTLDEIKKGDLAEDVKKTQDKQREKLYKQNIRDTEELTENVEEDCRDSFDELKSKMDKKQIKNFCKTLAANKDNSTDKGISKAFPGMTTAQRQDLLSKFRKKYIPLAQDKIAVYEKQRETLFADFEKETKRHFDESNNLKDMLQIDPRIALEEMKAINEFTEKLMKEQAYIYTDGMKDKKAQFEEACKSLAN